MGKCFMMKTLGGYMAAMSVIMAVAGSTAAADTRVCAAPVARHNVFTPALKTMLPPEIVDFVERYLYQRLFEDQDRTATLRRLDFDEVSFTFPLDTCGVRRLSEADGLAYLLDRGRTYRISWYKGDEMIGEMSFPASFNLILFTNQKESYSDLCALLQRLSQESGTESTRFVGTDMHPEDEPIHRKGIEFYLGHLTSDTYLDSSTGRPVWSREYPAESLANLFIDRRPVADVSASVAVKAYNGDSTVVRLPFRRVRELMDSTGCHPYFGVSEVDGKTGRISMVAVYHNPTVAYLHKMEVSALPEELWSGSGTPTLEISLIPYIKLHNLDDLWGRKQTTDN